MSWLSVPLPSHSRAVFLINNATMAYKRKRSSVALFRPLEPIILQWFQCYIFNFRQMHTPFDPAIVKYACA